MIKFLKQFFKQLFCKHDYVKTNWCDCYSNGSDYVIREYRCKKCGNVLYTDTRAVNK